jgi:poly-gamma-glutamate synthesis protein (capsule biosynthesis protein)
VGTYRLAVTGDVIMNSRVSVCREPAVLAAVGLLREADLTHAHLEIPLLDYGSSGQSGTSSDLFGAAEGALSWMRGPTAIADELRWLGVDIVSTASNHSLDFSYGGLRSTIEALDRVELAHAGTGPDLAAARAPAFVDAACGRMALVSMTSSFPMFARAGATRVDAPGRPGVNPLRYLHLVDPETADQLCAIMADLGMWVIRDGEEFVIHPPGLHNSIWRFRVAAGASSTACDEDDLAGNLEAIRYAGSVADLVVAHLHVQAWDGIDGRMSSTPAFVHEFARAAVGAGAGLVLVQGSHAPMRGIEVYRGVPILYDPGPLFRMGRREAQPHDFYTRWGNAAHVRSFDAGLLTAFGARDSSVSDKLVLSPREGNDHRPGFFLPICEIDSSSHRVSAVDLHPMTWSGANRATTGFPVVAAGASADAILDRVCELSEPYGTSIAVRDGVGRITVGQRLRS